MYGPGDDNLAGILDDAAERDPDRLALILNDGSTCSYGELQDEVGRWATTLADHGVGPGDRVVLADWGGVRAAAVTLAAAHLGASTAQMNPLLTVRELAEVARIAGCHRVAVAGTDAEEALRDAFPDGDILVVPDVAAGPVPPRAGGDGDDAVVLFTSGTTGLPKPVPISHAALAARMTGYRPPFAPERPPVVAIVCVPSFHVGGLLGLIMNLFGGETTVIQPRFDAGEWLRLVDRNRVVSTFLVPAMLARVLDHPDRPTTDLSSLRAIAYGAAAAPVALVQRAMDELPDVGFTNVFGQTETLGAYTTLSADDHRNPDRIGSVGRPLPGVEIRIVDPDTGDDVSPGEVGDLWVRSAEHVVTVDGWLQTGDLARQDADGYVYPHGRQAELINRGGEKIVPTEIATVLRGHPAVADAVVAGIPDDVLGERIGAAIVVRRDADEPDVDELRTWCRGQLAPFKLPEVVAFVNEIPANELGKLKRAAATELILANTTNGGPR